MEKNIKKGREKLPPEQKKYKVWTHIQKYKIDALGGKYEVNKLIKTLIEQQYNLTLQEQQ